MTYFLKSEYKLLGYRKSKRPKKKYDAILQNKTTKRLKHIPFGDNRYQNYHDRTGLNSYPNLIHGDPNRRRLYKLRWRCERWLLFCRIFRIQHSMVMTI